MQFVEQRHVDVVNLLGSKVAQVTIDRDERVGNELAVLAIRDRELLGGMDVIERQAVRFDVPGGGPARNAGDRRGRAERSYQEAASSYVHRDPRELAHIIATRGPAIPVTGSHYADFSFLSKSARRRAPPCSPSRPRSRPGDRSDRRRRRPRRRRRRSWPSRSRVAPYA